MHEEPPPHHPAQLKMEKNQTIYNRIENQHKQKKKKKLKKK